MQSEAGRQRHRGGAAREAGRHDADDGVGEAIEVDGTADGVWISAEALEPEAVAEDGFEFVAGLFFFGGEGAADERRSTESGEETGGSFDAIETNGIAEA